MPSAPSIMTPAVLNSLELAFMMDFNVSQACLHADISRDTYYSYIQRNGDVADKFARMRHYPINKAKAVILNSLEKGDVSTAKWLLERRERDTYGNAPTVAVNIVNNLSDVQLDNKIKHIEAEYKLLVEDMD